jgi:hypothetical protein
VHYVEDAVTTAVADSSDSSMNAGYVAVLTHQRKRLTGLFEISVQ